MIEKYYIVKNQNFLQEARFVEKAKAYRNEFIIDFFKEYGIDGNSYYIHGNGFCNVPFSEEERKEICLAIMMTEQNKINFGSQLKKNPMRCGLFEFKKSSPILKEFQKVCVTRQIVINLLENFVGDYFSELHFGGFSTEYFENNDITYLKVATSQHSSITPKNEGFTEIKASEYFKVLETLENKNETD